MRVKVNSNIQYSIMFLDTIIKFGRYNEYSTINHFRDLTQFEIFINFSFFDFKKRQLDEKNIEFKFRNKILIGLASGLASQ